MSICAECAKLQKTCCQRSDIVITDLDIKRMKKAGLDTVWERRLPEDYSFAQHDDPIWDIYTIDKHKLMQLLKRKPDGSCILLTDKGCLLDEDTRPVVCRIYPYYFNEKTILEINPSLCPNQLVADNKLKFVEYLNISLEQAKIWRDQFYQELRTGQIHRENLMHNILHKTK